MLFSAPSFLFGFLPLFLLGYFICPKNCRNLYIFACSLFFYFIEAGKYTIIFFFSILINFLLARLIENKAQSTQKRIVFIGIFINLAPLFFYKYWMFFLQSVNDASNILGANIHNTIPKIVLLAGISFYTFHAISYLLDVYSKKVIPSKSLINFGMYMANFPQLIAGPIVRYAEIKSQINKREIQFENIYSGLIQFVVGLSQKVIFADSAGVIADAIFKIPALEINTGQAWLGAIAYTIQIYFDFCGYSNMAIGIGRVMNFEFPENFNQPYRAKSITEFWRRWHMTLSRWFRDYVYIPLGGNQKGTSRTLTNLLIVFFLCGLWHGASYTFIAWGFYHGLLLIIERIKNNYRHESHPGILNWIATIVLIIIGWVIFRSETIHQAFIFIKAMFGISDGITTLASLSSVARYDLLCYLFLGMIVSIFPFEILRKFNYPFLVNKLYGVSILALFFISCSFIASNGFNPFIYFKF